jgi:multiple sugar transport system substrate-binding protein
MSSIQLTGITWDHPRGYNPLVAASVPYEHLNAVSVDWQARSLTNFGDQSLPELANHFDLLIIDHPHAGIAAHTKCLVPMDELLSPQEIDEIKEQTAGPCFTSYYYKGKQWALPIDAAMQCAAYRPDLLPATTLPANWTDVFALAASLQKKKLWVGTALCATDCLCSFLSITAQLGAPAREGNDLLVTREAGLKTFNLLRYMRDHFHPRCLEWNPVQLYDYMSTNDDIVYAALAFCYTNYSRDGFRKNKLVYSNAPGTAHALLGGAGIAVSAKSKHPVEAAKYAGWICSAAIQNSIYVREQGQPASLVAWKSDAANRLTHHFFLNTFDSLINAYVRPRYAGWPAFQAYLGEKIHSFLQQDSDPIQLLELLQEMYRQSYNMNA